MIIKIGVLYPSRLSLYGEYGNIKALVAFMKKREIDTIVEPIEDLAEANLMSYDFLYMGSGIENSFPFVQINIYESKKKIIDYIESGRYFLVTGNALLAFKHYNYFNIFEEKDYYVSNVVAKCDICNDKIKAFQNTKYRLKDSKNYIFNIEKGYGNVDSTIEGYRKNNFYVTTLIGPILALNPGIRNAFIEGIILQHEHNTN